MYGLGRLQVGAKKTKLLLIIGGAFVIVVVLAVTGFLYWQKKGSNSDGGDNKPANTAIVERVIERVGKLYILPADEEPTVAEIKDKSKLPEPNRKFFESAQDGDYLLVYTKTKLALIYRENINKLVNVGPVDFQGKGQPQSESKEDAGTSIGSEL